MYFDNRNIFFKTIIVYIYRCSAAKTCKASLTTDYKGLAIVKMKNAHNHEADDHKAETRQLHVRVRHNSGDVSQRPSKDIRSELQKMDESLLNPKDLKNVAMSMYREKKTISKIAEK